MAESLEWIKKFKNHEVFKRMKSKVSTRVNKNVSRNILSCRQGDVFLWDETSLSLLSFQLKNCFIDPHKDFCQKLTWVNPPRFEVENLLLAGSSSSNLALYGTGGIQVLSLPTHRLKVTDETSISCMCSSIDGHFFLTSGHKLVHVKFHPGFSSPDVLFILTSNNFIRIYSTEQTQEALTIINLQPLSPVPLSDKSFFGESFVSFDFSEMVEMQTRNITATPDVVSSTTSVPAWQVFLLMGNGQVSYITVVFDGVNTFRHIVHGTMRMYPAADDNYGLDACSLLHLPTTPPVLVVATSDGRLHHSLILKPEAALSFSAGDGDDKELDYGRDDGRGGRRGLADVSQTGKAGEGDVGSGDEGDDSFVNTIRNLFSSFSQSGRALALDSKGIISNPDNKKALYVFQTVELELQLSTPASNLAGGIDSIGGGGDNDADGVFYNRQILLHKDPTNKYRYHSTHPSGLHSILPLWLHNLEDFFTSGDKDGQWRHEEQTIVEHLVCTSPLPSSASCSELIGVAQIADNFLGNFLVTLNSHFSLTIIPFLQSHKLQTHPLKVETPFNASQPPSSNDLLSKLSHMLIKNSTNPIISGPADSGMRAEECFNLVCRATQVFRTEYIAKYDLVRIELDKNVSRLEIAKERQMRQQRELQGRLVEYMQAQEALKNKLNAALETQSSLCQRVNRMTYNAEKGIKVLSDAEKSALEKLRQLEQVTLRHSQSFALLKKRCSYNDEVVSGHHTKKTHHLPKEKTDSIKKLLKKEGEDIAALMKDLKKAQISVVA